MLALFPLHAIIAVIGRSESVVAAAYWLLPTRPASGKHSTLQQLFQALPIAQSLLQTMSVLDS